jgi:poly(A) polymerase
MLKLLQTGHALASIDQLKLLGLARGIYPLLDVVVERVGQPFVSAALKDTDRRVGEGKPVAPSFLLACVLWADVRDGWAQRIQQRQHSHPALQDAIDDAFNARIGDVSGRGKLAADMREIWMMQPRFDKRVGSAAFGLVEQPRFRAAFDFMRLRADVGEIDELLADWWQEFSMADDTLRQDMVDQVREEQLQRPRAPRVHKVPRAVTPDTRLAPSAADAASPETFGTAEGAADASQPEGGPAAPKRRRRRRASTRREGGDAGTPEGGQGPAGD